MKTLRYALVLCALLAVGVQAQPRIFVTITPPNDPSTPLVVTPGVPVQLTAKAWEATATNVPVEVPIHAVQWALLPPDFGIITPQGVLTAHQRPGSPNTSTRARVVAHVVPAGMNITIDGSIEVVLNGQNTNPHEYSVSGTVTDAQNAPVAHARIAVMNAGMLPFLVETQTDASGAYTARIPAGTYVVRAEAAGFLPEFYDNEPTYEKAARLTTDPNNKAITGINFVLSRGGVITGVVRSAVTNTPIRGASVLAYTRPGTTRPPVNAAFSGVTNEFGEYRIEGLPTDEYIVQAHAQGHLALFFDGKQDVQTADAVSVTAGATTAGIDFALQKDGSHNPVLHLLSGRVGDGNGNGIHGAMITAQAAANTSTPRVMVARSESDGAWRMMVPAGTYTVYAEAPGFMREWFDNVADPAQAASVVLNQQTPERTDINFSLGEGGVITGTVTDAVTTDPLPKTRVSIVPAVTAPPSNVPGITAVTDDQGVYRITGLRTGSYKVMAVREGYGLQYYDGVTDVTLATDVAVTEGQTTSGIDFAMRELPAVRGTVTDASTTAPIARAEVIFETANSRFVTHTDQHGEFHIVLPAGTYKARATGNGYATEWWQEQADPLSADDVIVPAQGGLTGIDFTLSRHGGSISGVVRDELGAPVEKAFVKVWLAPSPTQPPFNVPRFYGTAVSRADGSYEVLGVPPGSYVVSASAHGYLVEFFDDAAVIANATPVAVALNQQVTDIDFSLGIGGGISGTVVDAVTNQPIPGALVMVRGSAVTTREHAVRTDHLGAFTLGGLASGDYAVFAMAPGHLGEYYDGVTDPTQATLITVAAPNVTTGVNFTLDVAPRRITRYTGTVVDAGTRQPLTLTVIEAVDPETGAAMMTTTDETGRFEFTADADAVIRAHAIGYVGLYAGAARNWKESGWNGFADGMTFALEPVSERGMATLDGRITDQQTREGVPNAWVYGSDADGNTYFAVTDHRGRYAFDGTAGGAIEVFLSGVSYEPMQSSATLAGASGSVNMSVPRAQTVSSVDRPGAVSTLSLEQNYPNPFNPSTTIRYAVATSTDVTLIVRDALGREVARLVDGRVSAGAYSVVWNASDVPSGVYYYTIRAAGSVQTRAMVLAK